MKRIDSHREELKSRVRKMSEGSKWVYGWVIKAAAAAGKKQRKKPHPHVTLVTDSKSNDEVL